MCLHPKANLLKQMHFELNVEEGTHVIQKSKHSKMNPVRSPSPSHLPTPHPPWLEVPSVTASFMVPSRVSHAFIHSASIG